MENINETQGKRWPTPLAGSILYLLVLALMLSSSFFTGKLNLEGDNYYKYMFIIQFAIIALPPLLYCLLKKVNIRETARIKRISIPEILLTVGMTIFGYGVIIFLNLLWVWFLSQFGTPQTPEIPPIETGKQLILSILVIAVTPALVEEFLFRGIIQRGYERRGKAFSIIFTGLLFAFLHLSIVSVPAIIFMGMLLCYINYRSNSIWTGVIYHFINNSIAVVITFLSHALNKLFPMEGPTPSIADIPPETFMATVIALGVIGFFALILFGACFAGFHIVTRNRQMVISKETDKPKKLRFLELLPAIVAMAIIVVLLAMEAIQMVNPVM